MADGLDFYCKDCIKEICAERRQKYKETVKPPTSGLKRCATCKQQLDISQYHRDRGRCDGLQSSCKDCLRKMRASYGKRNQESYTPAVGCAVCSKCKEEKPVSEFAIAKERKCGHACSCKACDAKRHRQLKIEVMTHYTGETPRCQCCGEMTIEFLAMDHINGGGRKHYQAIKWGTIYRWLKKNGYPDGFQVLCNNCNMAKGMFGACPHQLRRQRTDAPARREPKPVPPDPCRQVRGI